MLVLSRKIGQRVMIGEGIAITVVSARGQHVRLGVEAPRDVTVLREELSAPDAGDTSPEPAARGTHARLGGGARSRPGTTRPRPR